MQFSLTLESHDIDVLMPALALTQALTQATIKKIHEQATQQIARAQMPPDAPRAPAPAENGQQSIPGMEVTAMAMTEAEIEAFMKAQVAQTQVEAANA